MQIFDHPNMVNFTCPICGTADDRPCGLVRIDDTEQNGIMEARQYHIDCIDLREARSKTHAAETVVYHAFDRVD